MIFFDPMTALPLDQRIGLEAASASRVTTNKNGTRIRIQPTDVAAKKNRCELKVMDCGLIGETWIYSYEVMIPRAFAGCPTYEIVGQMHDGKPASGVWVPHPPLLAMRHYADDRVDFVYGLDGKKRFATKTPIPFRREEFHKIEWRVFWSRALTGSADVKLDNNRVQLFSGANMWGHEPVYMKIGLYRPDGGGSSTSIVVRNWSIKKV